MDNKQNKDGFKERIRINLTMSTRPVGDIGFETLTNGEMECNCTNMEYVAFIKDLILGYTKNDSATTLKFLKVLAISLAEEFEKDETDNTTDESVSYSERETTKCNCDHCMKQDEEDDEIEMKVIQVKNKQQAKKILDMLMGIAKESN